LLIISGILVLVTWSRAEIALPADNSIPDKPVSNVKPNRQDPDEPPVKAAPPVMKLNLDLTDGSQILGKPEIDTLVLATDYAEMKIALKLVQTVEFQEDHTSVAVSLNNGDSLRGKLKADEIRMDTLFGKVKIASRLITRLEVIYDGGDDIAGTKDMVLYFPFDRDEGGTVTDKSRQGNNGTVKAAKWVKDERRGGAYEFDGSGSMITVADAASLRISTGITVAAWIKTSSQTPQGTFRSIIMKGAYSDRNYTLVMHPTDKVCWTYIKQDNSKWSFLSKTAVTDGKWHHIAGTWDGKTAKLYVDGNCEGESEWTEPLKTTADPVYIGYCPGYGFPTFFNGLLDEVTVLNRAIPESKIKALSRSR